MNLHDALFNWLQMKIVAENRPDDQAALDTLAFFNTILKEDHQLDKVEAVREEQQYIVRYSGNEQGEQHFDGEMAEKLLHDIVSNPKYN